MLHTGDHYEIRARYYRRQAVAEIVNSLRRLFRPETKKNLLGN